jgi:hypothetical protein
LRPRRRSRRFSASPIGSTRRPRISTGRQWTTAAIVAEDSDEALAALLAEGLSLRQIAERTGLSKSEVGRRLKEGGR